ncbi:ketoacyl-ACP synthase III family protein [Hydrogenophaga sp. A37]|uniref:ketoacyl-ACP synthase III family protein n=1 Tax=Hydrogenophaga sp. A37 TaxID=1945864 RepID=UPI0015C53FE5|nr:ketoacyl-ACP synthase III family protein [Hydrogenophaga sp. A37]
MTGLSILDLAVELPASRTSINDIEAAWPHEVDRLSRMGYEQLAVETERTAGQLAIAACRNLTLPAGPPLTLVVHASTHAQGMGVFWNPATAVQAALEADHALPIALRQGCDGLLVGLQVACTHLGQHATGRALLVGSDCFGTGGFCRVTADYSILYGDGAAAMVIGVGRGIAHILAIETVTDPGLNALHDGTGLRSEDVRAAKRRFLSRHGRERLQHGTRNAMSKIKNRMAPDAASDRAIRHILFPHLGLDILRENYFPAFDQGEKRSLVGFGAHLGHMGTIDQIVALQALVRTGHLEPGDRVLLIGAGAGFTWTAVLLEIAP